MKTLKILLTLAIFSSVCFAQNSIELINACKNGDLQTVKTLIRSGADINSEDENRITALMWAAKNGHLEVVKELIKYGADVIYDSEIYYRGYHNISRDNDYYNKEEPFCYAIDGDNIEILKLIIKKIEDRYSKDTYLVSLNNAIRHSIIRNKIEISKLLLNSGVDIYYKYYAYVYKSEDDKSHHNLTPIKLAAITRNLEILKEMVKLIGNNDKPKKLYDVLAFACRVNNNVDIVKYLIGEGASVNSPYNELASLALVNTIENEDIAMMKELIRAKVHLNIGENTPLMLAIRINNLEIVKELIKSGASVTSVKGKQYKDLLLLDTSLLIWAISRCKDVDISIIEELIKAGVDINIKNFTGETALMVAVKQKRFDIVELLEKYGAN